LSAYDAGVITAERDVAEYYDRAVDAGRARGVEAKLIANWVTGELFRLMKERTVEIGAVKIAPAQIPDLIALVNAGMISNNIAKNVFEEMFATGDAAQKIVQAKGLGQISDRAALVAIVEKIIADNPNQVAGYRAGKTALAQWFVGQVMKATRGQANPALVNELVADKLK
jgi:aspartyl-tRNA(Asn)/glutamyl-tRNA(Gln) amidotransferase subunit B